MEGRPAAADEDAPDEGLELEGLFLEEGSEDWAEELFLEELAEEFAAERLAEERLEDDGEADEALAEGDGGLGAWGLVGLLAPGHPLSTRPAASARAAEKLACVARGSMRRARLPVCGVIGPAKSPGADRHAVAEAGPEWCFAQAAHNFVGLRVVLRVLIEPLQVHHATAFRNPES